MEATKQRAIEAVSLLTGDFMNADELAKTLHDIYQCYAEDHIALAGSATADARKATFQLYLIRLMAENIEKAISE